MTTPTLPLLPAGFDAGGRKLAPKLAADLKKLSNACDGYAGALASLADKPAIETGAELVALRDKRIAQRFDLCREAVAIAEQGQTVIAKLIDVVAAEAKERDTALQAAREKAAADLVAAGWTPPNGRTDLERFAPEAHRKALAFAAERAPAVGSARAELVEAESFKTRLQNLIREFQSAGDDAGRELARLTAAVG